MIFKRLVVCHTFQAKWYFEVWNDSYTSSVWIIKKCRHWPFQAQDLEQRQRRGWAALQKSVNESKRWSFRVATWLLSNETGQQRCKNRERCPADIWMNLRNPRACGLFKDEPKWDYSISVGKESMKHTDIIRLESQSLIHNNKGFGFVMIGWATGFMLSCWKLKICLENFQEFLLRNCDLCFAMLLENGTKSFFWVLK